MTIADLIKLIRHYIKLVIAIPLACAFVVCVTFLVLPANYEAKATLLTDGDIALAGGFAQNESAAYSQNGISVSSKADTAYRTITITAEGSDYGGCIAAANATVLAAANDYRAANGQASITTNEATSAESTSPSILKIALIALIVGLFIALCAVAVIDIAKTPIKSRRDIENTIDLPILGSIPNRVRGERLLANIRFLSNGEPTSIAVVPSGLTGASLTCAELTSAFKQAGYPVNRSTANPHAQGMNSFEMPGVVSIIECPPLSEGMGAVYVARDASMTVVCAREWSDSRMQLRAIVEELEFAKANVGGIVYLGSRYSENNML